MNQHPRTALRQQGAALAVGLILLVVITVLAISGMNTATTELTMARNAQYYENSFQAAETGLEHIWAQAPFNMLAGSEFDLDITANESVSVQIEFENTSIVPDRAFSLGTGTGLSAYHFNAVATAISARSPGVTTDRDVLAVHSQAFYIVGPVSQTL
jgi:type IV pilus assembly protein PilX